MSDKIKAYLGQFPISAEIYWNLLGRQKTWLSHYELDGIKFVLPKAVAEVQAYQRKAEKPKKVCIFATLHYWNEQSVLVALALAGQGHDVTLAWLPYAEWDKEINLFDLRKQDLYTRDVLKPATEVMRVDSLLKASLAAGKSPRLTPELQQIVEQVSDYDTQYTLQIEETDTSSPLYQLRLSRNAQAASALYDWLRAEKPDLLIVPNGTILEMGVAYKIAKVLAIDTVTFEFADQQERIWLAQNDEIMSHNTRDLWRGLGYQALPEKAKHALMELFGARKNARLWGSFARQWQQTPIQGGASVRESLKLTSDRSRF